MLVFLNFWVYPCLFLMFFILEYLLSLGFYNKYFFIGSIVGFFLKALTDRNYYLDKVSGVDMKYLEVKNIFFKKDTILVTEVKGYRYVRGGFMSKSMIVLDINTREVKVILSSKVLFEDLEKVLDLSQST